MSHLGYEAPGVRTPGYVLSEMRTVDNLVLSLVRDISRTDVSDVFLEAFTAFVKDWREFYDENKSGFGAWWARGTTPVYMKTLEYRNLAMQWRDRFVRQGGSPSSVPLPEPKKFSPWPYILGLGLVVGLGYLVFGDKSE